MSLYGFDFPPLSITLHIIREWDAELERYICDCGHASTTATDHERHALEAKAQR